MKKAIVFGMAAAAALGLFTACNGKKETAVSASAASKTANDTLKLVLSTTDGSSKDDRVPSPWMNRTMATNMLYRSLFIADSSLTSVSPDLAESYEISNDGLTYTIKMKDGLKWSDGETLDASDVLFSLNMATKVAQLNPIYTAALAVISEAVADGNTVILKLSAPYASMLDVLAQFAILPEHCLKDADPLSLESNPFWQNPVSSGIYKVNEFNVGNYFTMVPNENYEGQAPKIQKVTVSYVSDYLTAAQAGNTDYIYGNATDMVDSLSVMDNFNAYAVDILFYKYFIFNMKGIDGKENPAMQNVAVRRAIIEAVDRASLATLYPSANVLNSGVPDSYTAYNGYSYAYDPAAAKAALAQSGYDLSKPLRICYYNNDQTSIDLINTVVYYLEQIGFKVEATLSNDGTTDLFTNRNYDVGFKGKSAFSISEWYSEYLSSDSLFNKIYGGDTSFDSLIARLSAATTPEERDAVLGELQKLEQEKVYKVPLFTVGTYVFTSTRLNLPEGVNFCNPLYSCDMDFANWTLSAN